MATPDRYPSPDQDRDRRSILRIAEDRDPDALRELLTDLGPRVRWALEREFRGLREAESEEAMNAAAMAAWQAAESYDETRGTVRAWFYVIARNAALGILRREARERRRAEVMTPERVKRLATVPEVSSPERPPEFHAHLWSCVGKLPRLQRAIIEADLQAGHGLREAAELASELDTSKNSIYVSRSIARKSLRRCLESRGYRFEETTD